MRVGEVTPKFDHAGGVDCIATYPIYIINLIRTRPLRLRHHPRRKRGS